MYGKQLVVDVDRHVMEPGSLWTDYFPAELRDQAPIPAADNGDHFMIFAGTEVPRRDRYPKQLDIIADSISSPIYAEFSQEGFSATSQIAAMDVDGIDLAVLFPTRGLALMGIDIVDPKLTTAVAKAYNDWLKDYCRQGAGRLFGVGMIDPRDVASACDEVVRCVDSLGFVGVFIRPNPVLDRPWYDEVYDPLWSLIASLDVPLCFHEGSSVLLPQSGIDRFEANDLWHVCTHPMEQQMAMVSMILGGVLDRHPELRCAFLEAGAGWLPYWMWRMDEHAEGPPEKRFQPLSMPPSDFVRQRCFVGADSDESTATFALSVLDGQRVAWGSDFPHPDAKYPESLRTFLGLNGMTPEWANSVLWNTPSAMYGPVLRHAMSQIEVRES